MIAALPMYDWPETRPATDRYWQELRRALAAEGVAAPKTLDRTTPPASVWEHPDLVLAQTCGLPYASHLRGRVTLIGAPDFAVPGCPSGFYRSAIVVRLEDPRDRLAAYRGEAFAFNERQSQSGFAAMARHAGSPGAVFGRLVETGAHATSAAAVVEESADIASLDYVSWRLIRRFRPEVATRLRVLMLTDTTPGLPYVTAAGREPAPMRRAIARAIAALDPTSRSTLGLAGFVPLADADYTMIAARAAA